MHIHLMTIAVLSIVSGFGFLIAGLGTLSGAFSPNQAMP
jgi:hypothetical protein